MIIAGNWKMNMTRASAETLTKQLAEYRDAQSSSAKMVLFPPAVLIDTARASAGANIAVGGQDCHANDSGAHTGDISAAMLSDAGCAWALCGHSERRADHHESSSDVRAKAEAALRAGLNAMICVGETLDQREAGQALEIVGQQVLDSLPEDADSGRFAIAYEPVWAIGTGKVASPDDVDAMHNHIRSILTSRHADYAEVDILYGGSVKPDNAKALLGLANVGGALVGGASLKAEDFIAIAEAAS